MGTIKKRFDRINLAFSEDSRPDDREILLRSTEGMGRHISDVILYDETLCNKAKDGTPLGEIITAPGAIPGSNVDTGAKAGRDHRQDIEGDGGS